MLPTGLDTTWNLKFTVKEDTFRVRNIIASTIWGIKPAVVGTVGEVQGEVKVYYGKSYFINFDIEVLTYDK